MLRSIVKAEAAFCRSSKKFISIGYKKNRSYDLFSRKYYFCDMIARFMSYKRCENSNEGVLQIEYKNNITYLYVKIISGQMEYN